MTSAEESVYEARTNEEAGGEQTGKQKEPVYEEPVDEDLTDEQVVGFECTDGYAEDELLYMLLNLDEATVDKMARKVVQFDEEKLKKLTRHLVNILRLGDVIVLALQASAGSHIRGK